MTVYIDPRAGSKELVGPLRQRGLRVKTRRMEFGDVAFAGVGHKGTQVQVLIEYKKLSDVLQCITTGRFSDVQLPGLQKADEPWLLVEGVCRPATKFDIEAGKARLLGELLYLKERRTKKRYKLSWETISWGRRRWTYMGFIKWLFTQEIKGRVLVDRTTGLAETAAWIHHLYSWWAADGYDSHKSHLDISEGAKPRRRPGEMVSLSSRPGFTQRMLAQLPGLGWDVGAAVARRRFKSLILAAAADEEDWANLPMGKKNARLGLARAKEIVRILQNGD